MYPSRGNYAIFKYLKRIKNPIVVRLSLCEVVNSYLVQLLYDGQLFTLLLLRHPRWLFIETRKGKTIYDCNPKLRRVKDKISQTRLWGTQTGMAISLINTWSWAWRACPRGTWRSEWWGTRACCPPPDAADRIGHLTRIQDSTIISIKWACYDIIISLM